MDWIPGWAMDLLKLVARKSRDMYGQEAIQGIAWDLIPWFIGASLAFIVVHVLFMALWMPRIKKKSAHLAHAAGD